MKSRLLGAAGACATILSIFTPSSQAAIVFSWEFDAPTGAVSAGDWAVANATMTLDASSDSVTFTTGYSGEVGGGTSYSGIFDGFYFNPNGPGTFFSQFAGVSLDPTDSFSFTFGAYSASPTATVGQIGSAVTTNFTVFGAEGVLTNGFSRTAAVVPVPAAAWLFCSGLLGLTGLARKKINKN